jgi:hypothetical protein
MPTRRQIPAYVARAQAAETMPVEPSSGAEHRTPAESMATQPVNDSTVQGGRDEFQHG